MSTMHSTPPPATVAHALTCRIGLLIYRAADLPDHEAAAALRELVAEVPAATAATAAAMRAAGGVLLG